MAVLILEQYTTPHTIMLLLVELIWRDVDLAMNHLFQESASFYRLSNVIFYCSFNSSLTQAILVFSQVSGDVYINNSVFTHNTQHRGHGAAVQYTPESTTHTQTKLVINNCNFSYNGVAKSVIYIDGSRKKECRSAEFLLTKFIVYCQ